MEHQRAIRRQIVTQIWPGIVGSVATAVILGGLTLVWTHASSGGVIHFLGGYTQNEVRVEIAKQLRVRNRWPSPDPKVKRFVVNGPIDCDDGFYVAGIRSHSYPTGNDKKVTALDSIELHCQELNVK